MAKKKNRRQQFPPITVAALQAARGAVAKAQERTPQPISEPEPTSHIVLTLASHANEEDAAWDWFAKDEYRRGLASGKTRKQISRHLRRDSFLAGYRAGSRAAR